MGLRYMPLASTMPPTCLGNRGRDLVEVPLAEEMIFGESSGGASDDLARVAELARRMVCDYGMSERVRAVPSSGAGGTQWHLISDETQRLIDSEVSKLVEEGEDLARSALAASRDALERVAGALLEKETLTMEEVEQLAGPPPSVARRNGAPTLVGRADPAPRA